MKKIEKGAVAAFNAAKYFKKGNTEVVPTSEAVYVYLHGNLIVWKDQKTGEISYHHCGWHTPTTASRLRAFGANAHIKNGVLIIQ